MGGDCRGVRLYLCFERTTSTTNSVVAAIFSIRRCFFTFGTTNPYIVSSCSRKDAYGLMCCWRSAVLIKKSNSSCTVQIALVSDPFIPPFYPLAAIIFRRIKHRSSIAGRYSAHPIVFAQSFRLDIDPSPPFYADYYLQRSFCAVF